MSTLLCAGDFDVLVRKETSLKHVLSSMVEPAKDGNIVRVKGGDAFIQGSGMHFVLPGEIHFGFPVDAIRKISTPNKGIIWQNRADS